MLQLKSWLLFMKINARTWLTAVVLNSSNTVIKPFQLLLNKWENEVLFEKRWVKWRQGDQGYFLNGPLRVFLSSITIHKIVIQNFFKCLNVIDSKKIGKN